ncbi:MAG: hypothetical protein J1F40_01855 [Prevotellaceae bacterium]|nr:hypothetical protein [Prevotellaceae bacterium]
MNVRTFFQQFGKAVSTRLSKLSFRTGVIVLTACIPFYIISFAQMALPISTSLKGALWVLFFGLAKTAQYGGLTILGAEGIKRLKKHRKRAKPDGAERSGDMDDAQ